MKQNINPIIRISAFTAIVFFIFGATGCAEAQQGGAAIRDQAVKVDLDPAEFKAAIDAGGAQLVDVRTPGEHAAGSIPGNINIDWNAPDHERSFAMLDPSKPVLLYCRSGGRSRQAMEYLRSKGYQVQHLDGGIGAWMNAGLPVTK